jgi:hypothetical protein
VFVGNDGDDEPPVTQAKMCNVANSLLRQWRGCLMNVFLLRDEELHITMMNLVTRILVSGVVFVTILKVVVMIVVVEGVLVMRIGVQEVIVIMVAVFASMMKMNLRVAMRSMMMMRILLHTVDHLNVSENVVVLLVMMVTIVVVRTTLLMLNSVFQNFQERKMLMHILIGKSSVIKFS